MRTAAGALIASLSACAPTPVPDGAAPATAYRALGTEPFWSLAIDDATMRFEGLGLATVTVPRPDPRTSFNGHRYETGRMTVDVTHAECSDGMSDRVYPDAVSVSVDGRQFAGCGGH